MYEHVGILLQLAGRIVACCVVTAVFFCFFFSLFRIICAPFRRQLVSNFQGNLTVFSNTQVDLSFTFMLRKLTPQPSRM